jgi:hypothetical protein
MIGLNYEMNREMLWRAYPTDQRGTPFRYFWQWVDGKPDIEPIHTWLTANLLGTHARGTGGGGQLVMLVRGELVRRYPNMVLFANKSNPEGTLMLDYTNETEYQQVHKDPVFQGKLDPDIVFAGFDLTDVMLNQNGGWFFVVQEQPTEPRFGFDQPDSAVSGSLASWSDVSWAHTTVPEGAHLRLQGNPLMNRTLGGLTFGANSAHIAAITLQDPMRVAVHGRYLVKE